MSSPDITVSYGGFIFYFLAVKLIGKLQDGTVFLKKGHGENEEPFEFKTDEGNYTLPNFLENFSLDSWMYRISPGFLSHGNSFAGCLNRASGRWS